MNTENGYGKKGRRENIVCQKQKKVMIVLFWTGQICRSDGLYLGQIMAMEQWWLMILQFLTLNLKFSGQHLTKRIMKLLHSCFFDNFESHFQAVFQVFSSVRLS